jgi:hypothetical protein
MPALTGFPATFRLHLISTHQVARPEALPTASPVGGIIGAKESLRPPTFDAKAQRREDAKKLNQNVSEEWPQSAVGLSGQPPGRVFLPAWRLGALALNSTLRPQAVRSQRAHFRRFAQVVGRAFRCEPPAGTGAF